MATVTQTISQPRHAWWRSFDFNGFVRENITRTWYLTAWLLALAVVTLVLSINQFRAAPFSTTVVLIAWLAGLVSVAVGELRHQHTAASRWLKSGLFSSITNSLITLILVLVILAAARGAWNYAVTNASFDPAVGAPETRTQSGATWGVIPGNSALLMVGQTPRSQLWRVWLSLGLIAVLAAASIFAYGPLRNRMPGLRRVLTALWLLTPLILYLVLRGAQTLGPFFTAERLQKLVIGELIVLAVYGLLYWQRVIAFRWRSFLTWALAWPLLYLAYAAVAQTALLPPVNPDTWGGLLLTIIVAIFAIVVSFPLGVLLALGRRSAVQGIPAWLTWGAAAILTMWGLVNSTPALLEQARSTLEQVIAFWPLLIVLAAYAFQRFFRGNVVAAFSTIFIEIVRGVPLITVLFMAIILFPLFLPQGLEIKNVWRVLAGFTLFSAAYVAENVRGGLQAIPRGQYEAADSLGLNTLQKTRFIILPQALRIVIPPMVGLFIGLFKDTSLVAVVGLFDLLGIASNIAANPNWLGLRRELYIFVAAVFFLGSFAMSSTSRRLEARLGLGER